MTKGQGQIITLEIRYPNTSYTCKITNFNLKKTQHTMTEGTGQNNLQIKFIIGNHTSSYLKKKKKIPGLYTFNI